MGVIDPATEPLRSKYLQTTGFDKFDDRRDFFLWVRIYQEEMLIFESDPLRKPHVPTMADGHTYKQKYRKMTLFPTKVQLLEDICYKLEKFPLVKEQLAELIPTQEIDWILNNTRQMSFIRKLIQLEKNGILHTERLLSGLSNARLATISIDLLNMSPNDKVRLVRRIKNQWRISSQPNKDLTWFKTDPDKKRAALNYHLQKAGYRETLKYTPVCNLEEIEVLYDSLQLDNARYILQEIQEKTRRRYQKQRFDEQHRDKKQYNIMLPTELIKKLDKQATKKNVKRSQLIFEILNEATNN